MKVSTEIVHSSNSRSLPMCYRGKSVKITQKGGKT